MTKSERSLGTGSNAFVGALHTIYSACIGGVFNGQVKVVSKMVVFRHVSSATYSIEAWHD